MAVCLIAACQPEPQPGRSGDEDMQELIEMVMNTRPKAASLAKTIGAADSLKLRPCNPDRGIYLK